MMLAWRDINHHLGRFLLTCVGLGLLLGVVMAMIGIYRGLVDDALTLVRSPGADLWVVESARKVHSRKRHGFPVTPARRSPDFMACLPPVP